MWNEVLTVPLLLAALHPSLDPMLVLLTLGQRSSLSPAVSRGEEREIDGIGNALSQLREGPGDGRATTGSFVLPERLTLLRENYYLYDGRAPRKKL